MRWQGTTNQGYEGEKQARGDETRHMRMKDVKANQEDEIATRRQRSGRRDLRAEVKPNPFESGEAFNKPLVFRYIKLFSEIAS